MRSSPPIILVHCRRYRSRRGAVGTTSPRAMSVKVDRHAAPLSAYLGVLGMPGATAYAGITEICKPESRGDGGCFGGFRCGRLGRRAACETSRSARGWGSPAEQEKCLWVQDSLGFDACVGLAPTMRAELARSARMGSTPTSRMSAARCRRRCSSCSIRSLAWRCAAWFRNTTNTSFLLVRTSGSWWASASRSRGLSCRTGRSG